MEWGGRAWHRPANLPSHGNGGGSGVQIQRSAAAGILLLVALSGGFETPASLHIGQVVINGRAVAAGTRRALARQIALDLGRQQQVLELIDRLRREARLTVVSTHDLSLAGQYADRLLLLDGGKVVADGNPSDVLSEAAIAAHHGAEGRAVRQNGNLFALRRRQEARWAL